MIGIVAVSSALLMGFGAQASAATGGATTFATFVGPKSQTATQHISGIGLTGPWQGWHLAIDYTLGSDCAVEVCTIRDLTWEMYSGADAVWGTCQLDDAGVCLYPATFTQLSGRWGVPVLITGGAGSFVNAGGGGEITGFLVDTEAVANPATGELKVGLWPA